MNLFSQQHRSSGSVMIFCLMIMAGLMFLSQQLITTVFVSSRFIRTMVEREHAEALALGGIQIAIAQLSADETDEPSKKEKSTADPQEKVDTPQQVMLKRVVPHLNRWQHFKFDYKQDEFDGEIKLCISSEQGKININNIFDFQAMDFKKPFDQIIKSLEVRGKLKPGQIYTRLIEFFKKRKRKLDDLSQLLEIKDLEGIDIVYNPPQQAAKGKQSMPNGNVTLQDLFTLWSDGVLLEPTMLSDALCAVFSLRRPHADDAQTRQEQLSQFFTKYDPKKQYDWEASWDILEPLYGEKPKSIGALKQIFTKQFGAKVFSVLSCGKVGSVESRALAIVQEVTQKPRPQELEKEAQKDTDNTVEAEQSSGSDKKQKKPKVLLRVVRLYWV